MLDAKLDEYFKRWETICYRRRNYTHALAEEHSVILTPFETAVDGAIRTVDLQFHGAAGQSGNFRRTGATHGDTRDLTVVRRPVLEVGVVTY